MLPALWLQVWALQCRADVYSQVSNAWLSWFLGVINISPVYFCLPKQRSPLLLITGKEKPNVNIEWSIGLCGWCRVPWKQAFHLTCIWPLFILKLSSMLSKKEMHEKTIKCFIDVIPLNKNSFKQAHCLWIKQVNQWSDRPAAAIVGRNPEHLCLNELSSFFDSRVDSF